MFLFVCLFFLFSVNLPCTIIENSSSSEIKSVTSRVSCYPIGCQILHVLAILYSSFQWTDLWIKISFVYVYKNCFHAVQSYNVTESTEWKAMLVSAKNNNTVFFSINGYLVVGFQWQHVSLSSSLRQWKHTFCLGIYYNHLLHCCYIF